MRVNRLAFLAVTSALLGCGGGGGDDGGTTGPPPPPPPGNQTLGSISTNVSSINLVAGSTQTITVSAYDTQGGLISNPGTPTFSIPQSPVAEVDGQGVVLGLSQGTAAVNVSLTVGAVTKTTTVAVSVSGTLPSDASVIASSGDYVFTPKTVAIARGGSVTWTFGGLEHTVTFTNTAGAPASINTGGYSTAVSRTFGTNGNFSYICTLHPGMAGQVIVR